MEILKLAITGPNVVTWQNYLISQGYSQVAADGNFGPKTDAATRDFQQKHGLVVDGEVGPITFNFASSLDHPAPNLIKSNLDVLTWIKQNLKTVIVIATTGTYFTEDWLAAISCRETGGLITKYVNRGNTTAAALAPLMRGDFTGGEYHGFSFWQIDVRSFPEFIKSNDWVNPQKAAVEAVTVLGEKKTALTTNAEVAQLNLEKDMLDRAITAAYNCGEGNTIKALKLDKNVDIYTANQNYSSQVFTFRNTYLSI